MAYTLKTAIAHKSNYGDARNINDIKFLVIHYTANDGDTDEANARYFQTAGRNASAHYFVDDNSVTNSVPDNYVAWHCGGKKYPSCATSGGGKFHGICNNKNSIGVELCDCQKNGIYNFTQATLNNAILLCRDIVKKYNIPKSNVIRHFDVVGKICPKPFVDDTVAWNNFVNAIYSGVSVSIPTSKPQNTTTSTSSSFKVGDKVKVLKNETHDGKLFKVWYPEYDVIAINGNIVTIGIGKSVTCKIDSKNIQKSQTIKVGDKVKVLRNVTYDGKSFKTWFPTYDVITVSGNKITIGIGKTITCNININDITKV